MIHNIPCNGKSRFGLQTSELASDKKFISRLKNGEISQPIESFGGFELFRLVNKEEHLKPLDEWYGTFANILRKPKFTEMMDTFQNVFEIAFGLFIFRDTKGYFGISQNTKPFAFRNSL